MAGRLTLPLQGREPDKAEMDANGFSRERELMVEQQLLRRDIRDPKVLEAFRSVPRHRFVDIALRDSAYADHPLPIGEGQTISQPYMVALMTQCLELDGDTRVLEIGTGCGYQAAILSRLAAEGYTIERIASLSKKAEAILGELGYTNVHFFVGDGTQGLPASAPYDGIIVTAGSPKIPEPLVAQLTEGGRLVIPVGGRWSQELLVVRREGGSITQREVCGCVFVPLVGEHGWA
jgi:protein-L-isoaspartate(D-aspartate) O-methyltransferase